MNGKPNTTKAQARAEAQHERILSAAQQCFIEHGFHAASMASIAETAEMSAGQMRDDIILYSGGCHVELVSRFGGNLIQLESILEKIKEVA